MDVRAMILDLGAATVANGKITRRAAVKKVIVQNMKIYGGFCYAKQS